MASRAEADSIRDFVDTYEVDGFEHIIDDGGVVWQKYGVFSQPAFAFINDDGTVETKPGAMDPDSLAEVVEMLTAT